MLEEDGSVIIQDDLDALLQASSSLAKAFLPAPSPHWVGCRRQTCRTRRVTSLKARYMAKPPWLFAIHHHIEVVYYLRKLAGEDCPLCSAHSQSCAPPGLLREQILQVLPQDIRNPLVNHKNRASLLEVRFWVLNRAQVWRMAFLGVETSCGVGGEALLGWRNHVAD